MRFRAVAGIALLTLISLFSTIQLTKPMDRFLYKFAGITEIAPDNVNLFERRFAALRALLPPHGTVGYIADQASGYSDDTVMAVQYALAPVLIQRGAAHALVVGYITQPSTDSQQFIRQHNGRLLKDLGNGLLLVEGQPR